MPKRSRFKTSLTLVSWTVVAVAMLPLQAAPLRVDVVGVDPVAVEAPGVGRLDIDRRAYGRLWNAGRATVPFPVPGHGMLDLEIEQVHVVAPGARFVVQDGDDRYEHAAPDMRFYRGTVAGDPMSSVSLNLFQGRLGGHIRTAGDEFTFGPESFDVDHPDARVIKIRSARPADSGPTGSCDGDVEAPELRSQTSFAAATVDSSSLLKAYIAIEGTVEWVAHHGGVTAAEIYTLNLIAQISAYWETDAMIQMQVPYSLMHASESDGYTNATQDTSVLLSEMRSKWRTDAGLQSVYRTSAQLFSHRPAGGGSGRAYLGTLCGGVNSPSTASDFGVNIIDGGGASWEIRLVGHEIGHNFSSAHTHCYSPEIDQCENAESGCFDGTEIQTTGTMMSYCSTRESVIHPRVRDERIRPAAEAAFPTCIDAVGDPGDVGGLAVNLPPSCPGASFQSDDGSANSASGYFGTTQANWVKRFTPSCYPFSLTGVEMLTWHNSVATGRDVRVVVYVDPGGTGDPANAAQIYSEDVTVQVVSSGNWNQYTLASPVTVAAGDVYVGFYDLEADAADTYIMAYDSSLSGDSWRQGNSTDPTGLSFFSSGTFMIRASGGAVAAGSVALDWDAPCNDGDVAGQDFAVYQGSMSDYAGYASVACSTARATHHLVESAPDNSFWLIVPNTTAAEGSYGLATAGERAPAGSACKTQSIGSCP